MIKKTLYFGNPAYLSLRLEQLVIQLPEVESNDTVTSEFKKANERAVPIEDICVIVLDNKRITITSGAMEALLDCVPVFHIYSSLRQPRKHECTCQTHI